MNEPELFLDYLLCVSCSFPEESIPRYLTHILYLSGNYVLTYLYGQPKLAQFVVQGLVSLFARITKLGWFDVKVGSVAHSVPCKGDPLLKCETDCGTN